MLLAISFFQTGRLLPHVTHRRRFQPRRRLVSQLAPVLGHRVVGVDIDPILIDAACTDHPDATWLVGDLATLDLAAQGEEESFDGALIAGNVMDFITPEHRAEAVRRVAAHVVPDGFVVIGCRIDRGFRPADLDAAAPGAGLRLEHRFATWDLRPWTEDADFAVSVLRR